MNLVYFFITGFFITVILRFFKDKFFNARMTFNLDSIKVSIINENGGIRFTTEDENWFIPRQTLDETKTVVQKNFNIIKHHFRDKVGTSISQLDLDNVCLKIALRYFQMYNHWRSMYKREANRDLTFLQKDFDNIDTTRAVIGYFQNIYPDNYEDKCEIMLGMSNAELKEAVVRKYWYDNK